MRGVGEVNGLRKKRERKKETKWELMDMDSRVVIAGGGGWVEVVEAVEGIKGDEKNKQKQKTQDIYFLIQKASREKELLHSKDKESERH